VITAINGELLTKLSWVTDTPVIITAKNYSIDGLTAVPEPMSIALTLSGLGVIGMVGWRQRAKLRASVEPAQS
jgi:hypothetical protein